MNESETGRFKNPPFTGPNVSDGVVLYDQGDSYAIVTKYRIGQKVIIPDLEDAKSTIMQINWSAAGVTYQVAWFHDGSRKDAWVFENEIAPR
jgi:hypothetical protein